MRVIWIVVILLLLGAPEARAERVSVAAGKAVIAAGKAVAQTAPKVGSAAWRGMRWLAGHL